MNFSLYFFKRHTWIFLSYAFLIIPLFSESIPYISVSIDPIGNTVYKLDSVIPFVQKDIHIFDIRINGELGLPLSSFIFNIDEPPVYLTDSLRTRSVFQFIKGDYGFRDLRVKTQSLTLNKGTLTGFAHTRSYSGINGYIGNASITQNYLLNYMNSFKNSNLSITTAYHNEEMNIPTNNFTYGDKLNESYFSGISYFYKSNFGNFKYVSDLQVSETNIQNSKSEDWIYSQAGEFEFNMMGQLSPFIRFSESEENQYIYRLGFNWSDSLYNISLNSTYINSPELEIILNKRLNNGYIEIERKILDDYLDDTETYILSTFTIAIMNNSFNFQVIPSIITLDSFLFNSYRWSLGYQSPILMLNAGGCFYDKNDFGLRRVINTKLQINFPYFERYTPYLKTEYNNFYIKESISTNFLKEGGLIEVHLSNMNPIVHSLNFEFGFILESFKVSYHYRNILGEDGRFTYNYEEVPMHKCLKVAWQFRN
ncbi:hypothetical protein N9263_01400 [Candidatus Marinimicrobia bacterium]|nr:hypothetical protein [Candidatus Neomarinimicrobiota bacterium]